MERKIIRNKQDFICLINELRDDFIESRNDWVNSTVDEYLEAVSSYAEDISGMYNNLKIDINSELPSWQLFADILVGAKYQE